MGSAVVSTKATGEQLEEAGNAEGVDATGRPSEVVTEACLIWHCGHHCHPRMALVEWKVSRDDTREKGRWKGLIQTSLSISLAPWPRRGGRHRGGPARIEFPDATVCGTHVKPEHLLC